MQRAIAEYEKDVKNLPAKIPVDSVLIEGAGLQAAWLLDLLGKRNVQLIELKPVPMESNPHLSRLARTSEGTGGPWAIPVASFKFVQLRIAGKGHADCVPVASLPYDLRYRIGRLPFVTESCLAMTFSSESIARYWLHHVPQHKFGEPFAYWELFDRRDSKRVGALTTIDVADQPAVYAGFKEGGTAPYSTLANRLDNSEAPRTPPFLAYPQLFVEAAAFPETDSNAEMTVVKSQLLINKAPTKDLRVDSAERWNKAVNDSKATGWGYTESSLIHEAEGAQKRLSFPGKSRAVTTVAADKGFFVLPYQMQKERLWLAYYDVQGNLKWQVDTGQRINARTCLAPTMTSTKTEIHLNVRCLDMVEMAATTAPASVPIAGEKDKASIPSDVQIVMQRGDITSAMAAR